MKLPKVIVLLSTYNGEKYLQEQLESIYNQTYSNIEILVRDDGSKDNTKNILQNAKQQNKVKLIMGENVGFVNSFFELLKQAPLADYYAFADQEDVWEKEKIQRAVDKNQTIPIMYYTNYDFYDENMEFVLHSKKRNKTHFLNSLVECVNIGTATLMNEQARKKMLQYIPTNNCLGHDWWLYIICSAFGEVIYDDLPQVKHRMHKNNTSRCGESVLEKYIKCFYSQLTKENQQMIELFLKPRTFKKQIQKICYTKKIMNRWNEEIILRIGFLLWLI